MPRVKRPPVSKAKKKQRQQDTSQLSTICIDDGREFGVDAHYRASTVTALPEGFAVISTSAHNACIVSIYDGSSWSRFQGQGAAPWLPVWCCYCEKTNALLVLAAPAQNTRVDGPTLLQWPFTTLYDSQDQLRLHTFDLAAKQWERREVAGPAPAVTTGAAFSHFTEESLIVVHGGLASETRAVEHVNELHCDAGNVQGLHYLHTLDLDTMSWTAVACDSLGPRMGHTITVFPEDSMAFVFGGISGWDEHGIDPDHCGCPDCVARRPPYNDWECRARY